MVYAVKRSAVDTVICMGEVLMENRVVPGEEEIMARAAETARASSRDDIRLRRHAGKASRYLRTLGFDARYVRQGDDPASLPHAFRPMHPPH
jgi:hypothetical protein